MIPLTRRASLIVAFYLLTSAATASAECAWVLWGETLMRSEGTPLSTTWKILETATSQNECSTRRSAWMRETARGSGWTIDGGAVLGKVGDVGIVVIPQCLPDTIDPRGPKGK